MAVIRFGGFAGENRALHPKLLADSVLTVSRNQKPGRGDLRPWKAPLTVATVPSGRQTIYRMGRDVASDSQYWLSWTSVVNAVRGFDPADTTERTYYTGDGAPKVTDNVIGLATAPYPTASRPLGIPAPAAALTVSPTAGTYTGSNTDFYYVYTFVSDWGWESAPSPVSALSRRPSDQPASLTGFASVPAGNYNVNRIRIYRTQTGNTGTEFYFLREVALGTSTTTDDLRDLGESLPSANWFPAPGVPTGGAANITEPTLTGLRAMWNGMLAGISGNSVRFCEAYTPYAWPPGYDVVPPDSKPIGLGVFGQNLLVLTTGRPLLVNGSSPDSLDQAPVEMPQGCVSARSVVSMGAGVAWASEDGLCWFGSGGPRVLTSGLVSRDDWRALVPSSIIGQMYEGLYFGSYDDGTGRKGFMIDPANPTGVYFLDTGYPALFFDELQDQLYVLSGANVGKWDAGTALTARVVSKEFRAPSATNFGAAEVIADAYPVTFKLYADGALKHTQTVANRSPFRLPSGYKALDWKIELETTNPVQAVAVANAVEELKET